jgi:hypothetical protein
VDDTHGTIHVTDTIGHTATNHTTSIIGILF